MEPAVLLFAAAVSLDLAAAAFAIGSGGIKIPHMSAAVISAEGALFLMLPALFGDVICEHMNENFCRAAGKILLAVLGIIMLCKYYLKGSGNKKKYPLCVCIDESEADCADRNKDCLLSFSEAAVLGAGLSADSAVTGLSAGLAGLTRRECLAMLICAFVIGLISVELCSALGRKLSSKLKLNTGFIGGAILLLLAVLM
ncbi:MAG: manganese efflux pump [Oscillospiraceae bacterium]